MRSFPPFGGYTSATTFPNPEPATGSPTSVDWLVRPSDLQGIGKDLYREKGLIRLRSAAVIFTDPVTGKKPSPKTIWRWASSGVRGIRLKTVRGPSCLCTTMPYIREFLNELNGSKLEPLSSSRKAAPGSVENSQAIARDTALRIVNGSKKGSV